MAFIELENLSHIHHAGEEGETAALSHINLSLSAGEFVAVLGTNGSGKSTLAKHLNAILLPTEGICRIDGMDTRDAAHLWDIRQEVSMVFQNPDNQIIAAVVEEDVAFGPENLGVPSIEIHRRVEASLRAVEMTAFRNFAPHLLSGGQKQRLSIARALAKDAQVYIFDDTFSALDYATDAKLRAALAELITKKHATEFIVAQRISSIMHADKIIVLDQGKMAGIGTHEELLKSCEVYQEIAHSQLSREELGE